MSALMKVTIRKAKKKDLDSILIFRLKPLEHEIKTSGNNVHVQKYLEKRTGFGKLWKNFVLKHIRDGIGLLLVAETEGKLVGYSWNFIRKRGVLFGVDNGNIADIYVLPKYRGKGISTKLRDAGYRWFRSKKLKYASIFLVTSNKKPHEIYKRWGYKDYALEMRRKL